MMTDQDKVAAFLKAHAGFHFCSFCLSRDVGIDSFIARNVVWELQGVPGYQMRTTKCVSCVRSKRVITAVGGLGLLGPEAHVVAFLLTNKGFGFCNACLAFANEISLDKAQRVATYLQPLPEFERLAAGECSWCARTAKPVISARDPLPTGPRAITTRTRWSRSVPPRCTMEGRASTCCRTGWRWDGARSS